SISVWKETRLLALRPSSSPLRTADIPIGSATLQHGAQVEAQLLHRRPAEEPVTVVNLVDAQARLEHQRVRDHRIVMRVGIFRDVEIFLHFAPGVREKRPEVADPRSEFIWLEQVVGRYRHETAVADLHLAVELQQPLVLPPVLW